MLKNKQAVFKVAKLELKGFLYSSGAPPTQTSPYKIVMFGENRADSLYSNPAYKCKPERGGRESSWLPEFFVVDEQLRKNYDWLAFIPGGIGDSLIVIQGEPYFEGVWYEGKIRLFQTNSANPFVTEPVCLFHFRQGDQ